MPVRVLVVCDVRIYREGLGEALQHSSAVEDIRLSRDAAEAIESMSVSRPDVIVVDMTTPGSLQTMSLLKTTSPTSHLVALSVPDADEVVIACAEAGVVGYVSRDATLQEFCAAVIDASKGEVQCSPRVTASLVRELARRASGQPAPHSVPRLTPRERQVIDLIDRGLSNKEIARALQIALSTVKSHVHNILEKCKVHRRLEAATLIEPPASRRFGT